MKIQCPNCETVFELQEKQKINSKYKCSVCNHIWLDIEDKLNQIDSAEKANLKTIFVINTTMFLLIILVLIIFRGHLENIDSNWKSIYLFFDMLIPI